MANIVFYGIHCKGQLNDVPYKIASSFMSLKITSASVSFLIYYFILCGISKVNTIGKVLLQSTSSVMLPWSWSIVKGHLRSRYLFQSGLANVSYAFSQKSAEEHMVHEGAASELYHQHCELYHQLPVMRVLINCL